MISWCWNLDYPGKSKRYDQFQTSTACPAVAGPNDVQA